MGVPGDFQLDILDYIYDIDGMHFIGNSNELNAAYAADGYARVNHTPGCVVTTHGVGELSAINGIAGAASERIPLIHVVGQTPRMLQEKKLMIHHSIGSTGEVDAQLYNKTSKFIRADAAELWDGDKAPAEIDRVIRECVRRKAPVYIFMPLDLHAHRVKASLLEKKIDLRLPVDEGALRAAVEAVREAVCEAKRPVVFLDMLAHHAEEETRSFVDAVKLPVLAAHGAKAIVDGDHERFVGLYNGSVSSPGVADFIEGSDLVVAVGWWPADTNGGLGRKIGEGKRVDIMDEFVMVSAMVAGDDEVMSDE
jgi:pyruvate decarboxylase